MRAESAADKEFDVRIYSFGKELPRGELIAVLVQEFGPISLQKANELRIIGNADCAAGI